MIGKFFGNGLKIVLLIFCSLLPTSQVLADEVKPSPPIHTPVLFARSHVDDNPPPTPANQSLPSKPQPIIIDPTTIYNNLIVSNTLPQSTGTGGSAVDGPSVLPKVTNLANGGRLSYLNVPKPHPCVDFNDQTKWHSNGSVAYFAGWGAFAINDGGFYRSEHVSTSYDASIGNGLSAKISSNQPYAAGFASPFIQVKPSDQILVRVRYLLSNIGSNSVAYDWVSMGVKPDAKNDSIRYVNGYVRGQWAELENEVVATSDQIMILLQAHSPAALNSSIYFDDVEVFINQIAVKNCEI